MTKLFTAVALALTLSISAIAAPANAAPTYGLTIGDGDVNPFRTDGR